MKTILKMISGLLVGIIIGIAIAMIILTLFTDLTVGEFFNRLGSGNGRENLIAAVVGVGAFLVSLGILVPAHEAGHLVCGLLSGYKFVSFRTFNLTFIKEDGKIRVKRFSIAGTGGQCLLVPPDKPVEEIPTGWYNAGGVLVNLILLLIAIPFFWVEMNPYIKEALVIFCLVDAFLIVFNGIPMKVSGMGNDAYNMLYLRHNTGSKRALMTQLRSNAMIQEGTRPKDMPKEWFEYKGEINYKNPLEVSIPMMHASRMIDEMKWEEGYKEFKELYDHREDIIQLYVYEIACELLFCALVTGRKEEAMELLDKNLKRYIDTYSNVMSSKLRIKGAISLYLDGDKTKAEEIYRTLENNKDKYLLQGEVKSDLAVMKRILEENEINIKEL